MYLHLGQETLVKIKDIIGLFDIDTTTLAKDSRQFLKNAEKNKLIINISDELPRSFALVVNKSTSVYISQLAPSTLKKRYNSIF